MNLSLEITSKQPTPNTGCQATWEVTQKDGKAQNKNRERRMCTVVRDGASGHQISGKF